MEQEKADLDYCIEMSKAQNDEMKKLEEEDERLLMEAKALQQNQKGEEHYTSDIKPYYHDICYGRYYCDDYKWKIIEDEHTGEILCEHDD